MCFSNLLTEPNELEEVYYFSASGVTQRYSNKKVGSVTLWKNLKLVYNKVLGTIDGYGESVVYKKRYRFLLFGTIERNNAISFVKVHPEIETMIEYKGTLENNKIFLTGQNSSGMIMLDI